MDRLTIVVALLVSSLAFAGGGLSNKNTIGFSGARPSPVVAAYVFDQCGTGPTYTKGPVLHGVSTTTTRYYQCNGEQTAAAGTMRVEAKGLLSEYPRTQYLLNNCTAPATQAVSLTTATSGIHLARIEGTGSVALAAGTATATGLPCTATATSPCGFTITGNGTVTATVSGSVTFEQLENGPNPSSKICCAGTSCTRAIEASDGNNPLIGKEGKDICFVADVSPRAGTLTMVDATSTPALFTAGSYGSANALSGMITPTGALRCASTSSAGAIRYTDATILPTKLITNRLGCCFPGAGGDPVSYVNEVPSGTAAGAGNGVVSSFPNVFGICEMFGTGLGCDRNVHAMAVCAGTMDIAKCVAMSGVRWRTDILTAKSVVCFGDSMTQGGAGGTIGYPTLLQTLLGTSWTVINEGIGSQKTSDLIARMDPINRGYYSTQILWIGINDINLLVPDATIEANLATLYAGASNGMKLYALTILPSNKSGHTTNIQAVNAWIRANAPSYGATVVDTYATFVDGSGNIQADYDVDGGSLHINQAGQDLVSSMMKGLLAP